MDDLISRQAAIDALINTDGLIDVPWVDENGDAITDLEEKRYIITEWLKGVPSAQQWIPCSDRLPEALQEVLVTSTNGRVYTSRIVHGDFEYGGNVVAWMPLPEPYKGEE